jgi:hypothetical protein
MNLRVIHTIQAYFTDLHSNVVHVYVIISQVVSYLEAEISGSHDDEYENCLVGVRFQVLTAAGMMFRIVFWDVLLCKTIVDRRFRGSTYL